MTVVSSQNYAFARYGLYGKKDAIASYSFLDVKMGVNDLQFS
ncbi:MAG: hypothetical protein V7K67_06525 [Nostoc sp.]